MWRQKDKAVSSGKASYTEPKIPTQPDALAINMKLSPDGFSLGLRSRNANCYPSKPAQSILSNRTPSWPQGSSGAAVCASKTVGWYCHSRYLADMEALYAERAGSRLDIFYSRMDLTNPIQAIQSDQTEDEQDPNKSANDMNSSN